MCRPCGLVSICEFSQGLRPGLSHSAPSGLDRAKSINSDFSYPTSRKVGQKWSTRVVFSSLFCETDDYIGWT